MRNYISSNQDFTGLEGRLKHIVSVKSSYKANKKTPNLKSIWLFFWQQVKEYERVSSHPVTS